ncbi:hypothetical protein G7046_g8021 [Stylonectria norvegica]|nr:hypothetical protein G7046_g8021 [Stylonectria norvegica]
MSSERAVMADVSATNHLSELLDNCRNECLLQDTQITNEDTSIDVLTRFLSLGTIISTANSSSAASQQATPFKDDVGFRKIGFGQCGLVFERPGEDYVIKAARPHFEPALQQDYQVHQAVDRAFRRQEPALECRVPEVHRHILANDASWWDHHRSLFAEEHTSFPFPADVLITERISPLPKVARRALIDQFCDQDMQAAAAANPLNRDCLARIYLGKRVPPNTPLQRNFSLRNFNFHLNQMEALNLPILDYAKAIADALAVMHWDAHTDAYDVEFVLGSEAPYVSSLANTSATAPDLKSRAARIWVLDFNLCSQWEEVDTLEQPEAVINQLVHAFFENDPYYPLPLMENLTDHKLWVVFRDSYLAKADEILKGKVDKLEMLPTQFIDGILAREREKLAMGLGHGHRDCKG